MYIIDPIFVSDFRLPDPMLKLGLDTTAVIKRGVDRGIG